MKRWLLRVSVLLCALAVLAVGGWWAWREWFSAEQFRAAMAEGIETGDFSKAERLKPWGADTELWREKDSEDAFLQAALNGKTDIEDHLKILGAKTNKVDANRKAIEEYRKAVAILILWFKDKSNARLRKAKIRLDTALKLAEETQEEQIMIKIMQLKYFCMKNFTLEEQKIDKAMPEKEAVHTGTGTQP